MTMLTAKIPPKAGAGKIVIDPAHDLLREERHPLDSIFSPKNVAVIGATERQGSVGRTVLWNLISSPFGGTVYPVNPKRPSVLGIKAYKDIARAAGKAGPGRGHHPGAHRARHHPGVRSSWACPRRIVISAGFKENGEAGQELERQIAEIIRGRMRIIGPNCLGVMNPVGGLNATFASAMARPGNVAFISQSGALCTAVLDWSLREHGGLQRIRLHRLDARRRLGRPDRLPRRRPAHP